MNIQRYISHIFQRYISHNIQRYISYNGYKKSYITDINIEQRRLWFNLILVTTKKQVLKLKINHNFSSAVYAIECIMLDPELCKSISLNIFWVFRTPRIIMPCRSDIMVPKKGASGPLGPRYIRDMGWRGFSPSWSFSGLPYSSVWKSGAL